MNAFEHLPGFINLIFADGESRWLYHLFDLVEILAEEKVLNIAIVTNETQTALSGPV